MNKVWKNTQNEITVLMALDVLQMRYIARDGDGVLWAFEKEPEKAVDYSDWYELSGGMDCVLTAHGHFFDEISTEDETATKIEELLMNKIRENPEDTYQQIVDDIGAMFNRATQHQDRDIFDE